MPGSKKVPVAFSRSITCWPWAIATASLGVDDPAHERVGEVHQTRIPIWRPRSLQPLGRREPTALIGPRHQTIVTARDRAENGPRRRKSTTRSTRARRRSKASGRRPGTRSISASGSASASAWANSVGRYGSRSPQRTRAGQARPAEVLPGGGEPIRVGVAVEGEHGPAGAGVPAIPDRVDELRRHRAAVAARLAHQQRHPGAAGGPVEDLAQRAAAPDLGDPVPAVAGRQRHRVDRRPASRPTPAAAGRRSAPGRPSRGRRACAGRRRARRGSARGRPRARTSSSRSGWDRAGRSVPIPACRSRSKARPAP